jgi:hypothetical protein
MTDVKYNDDTHKYVIDGNELKSVTEIATEILNLNFDHVKHGAAERGTDIHSELARYFDPAEKFGATDCTIPDAAELALLLKAEPDMRTEMIVWNTDLGYAGTIDLIREHDTVVTDIIDWKTGKVNKKYCTIQLSLYKLALESMGYDCSNVRLRVISPTGITPIEAKTWDEVQAMRKGEFESDDEQFARAEARLAELEPYVAEYNELKEKLKDYFVPTFEQTGTNRYSGALYNISYVEASTRTGLDSTRLRAELPDVYEKYLKVTKVSPTIKITKLNQED